MARIIYVEDDELTGELVRQVLTDAGHLVGVIPHGTLGFDTIAFKKPELVILDRGLPGMPGIEILRQLRYIPELYLTPIIMLSAARGKAQIEEAIEAGANDYIVKPFEPADLVERVAEVLRNSKWRRR